MNFNFLDLLSVFMVLFAVIDITGSIPIIIDLKEKGGIIQAGKATLVAYAIMLLFLFGGVNLLSLFGVDLSSFAIAGSFVLFFLALEMVLGVDIFKNNVGATASIVPLAFPLIAGAGSMTTLLSLRVVYGLPEIIVGLSLNMIVVYIVLKLTRRIQKIIGPSGILILRKMFGIILMSISIKLFMSNIAVSFGKFFPALLN